MRDSSPKLAALALLAVAGLALGVPDASARAPRNSTGASSPPDNTGDSQADMCMNSYKLDGVGSDQSLQNSTVYAMQALMDLSNLHLVNAVKEGYNAYGKYRNAENLDNLKDKSALCANSLVSVGQGPVLPTTRTDTTFRRLDPSFLTQGDAGRVAAEFERETGMKRGDFLTEMASVSEKKIKRSDPMMIDKALTRFEGFLQKIPNAEFRKNAEKGIAMVPNTVRRGMVAQAVQKLAGFFADAGSSGSAVPSTITDLAKDRLAAGQQGAKTAPTQAVTGLEGVDASKNGAEASRDPAAADAEKLAAAAAAAASAGSGAANGKNGVEGVVAAALLESRDQNGSTDANAEPTIFQQVTQRYRILTPGLTGKN